jgi:hypothetical protein
VTPKEAEWVRAVVWRSWHHDRTPACYSTCACQWGTCGACERGDHHRCVHRDRGPVPSPEAYVCDRKGFVTNDANISPVVWLVDRTCRWICPCGCRDTAPTDPRPAALVGGQLDLFGGTW